MAERELIVPFEYFNNQPHFAVHLLPNTLPDTDLVFCRIQHNAKDGDLVLVRARNDIFLKMMNKGNLVDIQSAEDLKEDESQYLILGVVTHKVIKV